MLLIFVVVDLSAKKHEIAKISHYTVYPARRKIKVVVQALLFYCVVKMDKKMRKEKQKIKEAERMVSELML